MTITGNPAVSHLFTWQSDGNSTQPPAQIQGVPATVAAAFAAATASLAATERPPALLGAQLNPAAWPFIVPPPEPTVSIALATPVAEVAVSIGGQGTVAAFAHGTKVASASVSGSGLTWYPLATPNPSTAPIDQITVTGTGGTGSTVVIGAVASSPVTGANVGVRYALVNVPAATAAPWADAGARSPRPAGDDFPPPKEATSIRPR